MVLPTITLASKGNFIRAFGIGLATAVGTGIVTAPLFKMGVTPMPKAPSLAFAETLLGAVPDPVGMAFHLAYVTAVVMALLALAGLRPTKTVIAAASAGLWAIAVGVFFPIIGWGFAGAAITPKIALAAIGPHVLFGLVLWAATRLMPRSAQRTTAQTV